MRRSISSVLAPLLLAAVVGCTPTFNTAGSATAGASAAPTKSTPTSNLNSAIVGALEGFGGDTPQFKATDAAKIVIEAQDEHGQRIAGTEASVPDSKGGFTIKNTPSGGYFVVATLPDKSTNSALLRTDKAGDNVISPGTTLSVVWAKDQLAGKLLFLGDLPYADLLRAGVQFDGVLKANNQTLASTDDARFKQMNTLAAGNDGLKAVFTGLDTQLTNRAKANLAGVPPYTSQKEYDAKKKKLGLT